MIQTVKTRSCRVLTEGRASNRSMTRQRAVGIEGLGWGQHRVTMKPTSCSQWIPWRSMRLLWFSEIFLESQHAGKTARVWLRLDLCRWRSSSARSAALRVKTDVRLKTASGELEYIQLNEMWIQGCCEDILCGKWQEI